MKSLPNGRTCWEVMKCRRTDDCPARENPARTCWEIAGVHDCPNYASNICRDCIVFLLRNEQHIFSEEELCALAERKVACSCFLSWL